MDSLLDIVVWDDTTLGDLLSVEFLLSTFGTVVAAIAILVVGFTIARWISRKIRRLETRNAHLDATLFHFLGNIVYYAIVGFSFIAVLNTFGVETTSFVALIGAAALAIGLALQGTLSNVASGVMIILFRPFKLEDFVVVNGQTGTVKDITLNFVELASVTNHQVIVPNANVWGNTIENYTRYPIRRAEWTFRVSYGANLKTAEGVIRDTIMADPRSHAKPEAFVKVDELNDSSVDFLARVWCASNDYVAYKADMRLAVKEALDAADVEIPYPTRTLHIENPTT